MPANTPPELIDALKAFSRVAKALAEYLEAIAEVEASYGVRVEDLFRTILGDSNLYSSLPTRILVDLYTVVARVKLVAEKLSNLETLSAREKMELAEMLKEVARRLEELVGASS